MVDPYKMVAVNITVSLFLILGLFIYRFIYPKQKINLFVLLILILILPTISLLRKGDYESGDFNIHIHRIMSFYDSLKEGNIMPSWASELNATYGLPVFLFNYSLPYYGVSLFHFLGFGFIASMKIFLGFSLFFSGIFMYLWTKKLFNNSLAAFTSSIFYIFNPYHLIDVHFRATLGESLMFTVAPLIFYFITKYIKEKKGVFLILSSLFTGLLFLSHPVIAFVFIGIAFIYSFSLIGINKHLLLIAVSLVSGFFSSIYTWISFVIYSPYTFHESISGYYFPPFLQLFYSPWQYGFLFQGHKGELALFLGYSQTVAVICVIFLLFNNKVSKKIRLYCWFWLSIVLSILFLMHPLSENIWKSLPLFWMLFTTGRMHLPLAFSTAVIGGYFIFILSNIKVKKVYIYVFIFLTIASTILNWGHRRVIPEIDDSVLRKSAWQSIQITPPFMNSKWAKTPTFWFPARPGNPMEIISGVGTFKLVGRTTTKHSYVVNAQTPITIRENTLYFPGWSLKSNNHPIALFPGESGIINAKLPRGLQYVEVIYKDLPLYDFFKKVSAGLFLIMIVSVVFLLTPPQKKGDSFSFH